MNEPKASASGPLWAYANKEGVILSPFLDSMHGPYNTPCRIIHGHGKWVPAEAVERIDKAWDHLQRTADNGGNVLRAGDKLEAAIRAALEGKV